MSNETNVELAAEGRSKLTLLAGIVAAVVAAAGLIGSGAILITTLSHFLDGNPLFAVKHLIISIMWVVFFVALMVAGIHLIKSGLSRRLYNLVPGVSLYFAGLALTVNGFYFFAHQQFIYAVVAIILGLVLIAAEWGTETI